MICKICLSLVLALTLFKAQAQGHFVIEGYINNAPPNAVVSMYDNEDELLRLSANDSIVNGKFRFEGETRGDSLGKVTLMAKSDSVTSMILDVWVRPGSRIKVTGDNMLVYTWNVESDIPEQQMRQKIVSSAKDLWDELQLNYRNIEICKARIKAGPITENQKKALQSFCDTLKAMEQGLFDGIVLRECKVMKDMPVNDAWMSELLGNVYFAETSKREDVKNCVKSLYDGLSDYWKNTTDGAEIGSIIYPPDQACIGSIVEDGDLFDLTGKIHHLSDFKGKYILVDFWSFGCGPCVMALPELKDIAEANKDSLEVVSISLDSERNWRLASDEHGIAWHNFNDKKGRSGIAAKYGVYSIPCFVLVSPKSVILDMWTGYMEGELKKRVKQFLTGK